ncbi:MAG: sigma-54-dependent Fis family transcriptional regulator [Ignavibacteria bacterium]|nr:sigma-54-dependent Fis family transcriptional regulator [Ignavibacteria bacterium]
MPDNFDYSKDIYGTLSNIVQNSLKEITLIKEITEIPKTFDDLITNDPEMIHLISFADFIAKYNNNVLLLGETGTGKELFARAIHESSKRTGEFIPVNCGAIPKELFEAELFGITKKFATLVDERIGKFEAANKGTIFLDEIGEIPMEIQSKLLRVIETKEVTTLGSNKPIKVDFRLICATNKPLLEVLDKEFRGDLYYRIDEININLPSLRQRVTSDVEKLLDYFLKEIKKINIEFENITITESVLNKLRNHEWLGNVRELKRFVQKSFFIAAYMSKDIDDEILNRGLDLNIIEKETGSGIIEKI